MLIMRGAHWVPLPATGMFYQDRAAFKSNHMCNQDKREAAAAAAKDRIALLARSQALIAAANATDCLGCRFGTFGPCMHRSSRPCSTGTCSSKICAPYHDPSTKECPRALLPCGGGGGGGGHNAAAPHAAAPPPEEEWRRTMEERVENLEQAVVALSQQRQGHA